ncbi:ABC transporter ATP-binding protein [Corynebacterium sp. sy017]|uniref:dipeptide ABC transporter ATP-binding protein n=1 Tax=unclassified Corynebacterium TaxID=2624378 RepID=UPI001185A942|nr:MULTISPECIES: ABC transporter ATP-binding protein [unclassified Corynebacterium]MBP3088538.1 ABC transporter ATP-binding protein [Corynebacterium sp. sy017]TSD91840.1 ABC transporter ATP-binding protein [Corynebacterium sp. SY003]
MSTTHTALEVKDLAVTYTTKNGVIQAVQDVSFTVLPGRITAIVGESGSGKSTTASAIMGLLADNADITSGSIRLGDTELSTLSEKQWRSIRGKRIALVPQDPHNSLNPLKKIGDSVAEGLRIHRSYSTTQRKNIVLELLAKVGIDDPPRRYHQYPHELSGGMKQRCLIAAALALEPEFIIADEPTSALDVTVQKVILDLIDSMRTELGLGVLLITHDLAVAGDRADDLVVMHHGLVKESGHSAQILSSPTDHYTKQLLADAPSLNIDTAYHKQFSLEKAAQETPVVRVEKLSREFSGHHAVSEVSFPVYAGTTHAIVGESGSGKTTTGRIIAALDAPSSGRVLLGDTEITKRARSIHKRIQLVYQNPYSSLDPRLSIGATLRQPLRNFRLGNTITDKSGTTVDKVKKYLELVSLDPALATRRPAELSGGQRQRVAIARALIAEPEVIVFDEAVSALDVSVQAQILQLLSRLQKELQLTYIFISHDLSVVQQISDTVSVMSHGKQVEYGSTYEVFHNPQHELTHKLIHAIPGAKLREGFYNLGL